MAASDLIPLTLELTEAELELLEQAAGGTPPAEWLRVSALELAAEVCRLAEEDEDREDHDDEPEEEEADPADDPAEPAGALAVGIEAEWLEITRALRRGQMEATALGKTILGELYRQQALADLLEQRSGIWRDPDPVALAEESAKRARERIAKIERAIDEWLGTDDGPLN